jgi:peptide/nickel transport system substrate-binding protein
MIRPSLVRRSLFKISTAALALSIVHGSVAAAQDANKHTLRVVSTQQPSVLDVNSPLRTLAGFGMSMLIYDKLVSYKAVPAGDGFFEADLNQVVGELAEKWSLSDDQKTWTFVLRSDATFHDGTAVTADDVVWSIQRAIELPGSKGVMTQSGMPKTDQVRAVDQRTVAITLDRPNPMAILALGSPITPIIEAKVAKAHATTDDPWAVKFLEKEAPGGGAYKIDRFVPNEQIIYSRYDNWKSGKLPYFDKIIYQVVPEPLNIIAMLERNRADFSTDVPFKDMLAIAQRGLVDTGSISLKDSFDYLAMNTQSPKLKDKRVRQAIAYAVPYADIFASVYRGKGIMLNCPKDFEVKPEYPQAFPYCTDYAKSKALLAEAGIPAGFKLTFSYDAGRANVFEPIAVLLKESLAKVGIDLSVQKMVASQYAQATVDHTLDFYGNPVAAWFGRIPNYWFSVFYQGSARDNHGNYDNAELRKLVEENNNSTDKAANDARVVKMVKMVQDDVPEIPLHLRTIDIVQAKDITHDTAWYYAGIDFRQLERKQ